MLLLWSLKLLSNWRKPHNNNYNICACSSLKVERNKWHVFKCSFHPVVAIFKLNTSSNLSHLILPRVLGFTVVALQQCLGKTFFLCWPGFKLFLSQHHFILMAKALTLPGELAFHYYFDVFLTNNNVKVCF